VDHVLGQRRPLEARDEQRAELLTQRRALGGRRVAPLGGIIPAAVTAGSEEGAAQQGGGACDPRGAG
jgi:hypothetical protein